MNGYLPLLIMAIAALVLALGGLGASAILGPSKKNRVKTENYECGIDPAPHQETSGRFPVKYYLVAMTFIIFDIEVVFMYPWVVNFVGLGGVVFIFMMTFVALITIPFVYEWRRGGLEWD
ncbi:NADH dehydrogenase [Boudabousia liubingyangii]|uniref:NADH-quinone oxidoreductase subunit A n=1 Tax=Boudabousia liubingyangii TaxID=1921764 RepID=A0A1Q5PQ37_9ACTO|nr:NADH-quinone oxidoreductase subunit A [Boudabousia liubingyangii]OKL48300.1 NADH dehydrogenase [Boudabousia liubingyangii]OKL49664.1 NADH dehydrogenase [Boudabousia liubingyangii]